MRISLSVFTIFFFAVSLHAAPAKNAKSVSKKTFSPYSVLKNPALENTSYSFYAKYINGKDIIDINKSLRLAPASVTKLFTTAAALNRLGPSKRFVTAVYYDGEITGTGTLKGNVYIRGGGDPALGSDRIEGNASKEEVLKTFSDEFKKLGVKKINGDIIADASLFSGPEIPVKTNWQDAGNYYSAPASALNMADNQYEVCFKASSEEGAAAEIVSLTPVVNGLSIKNEVLLAAAGSGDKAFIHGGPGQYNVVIRGTIPVSKKDRCIKGSVPIPAKFAADEFRRVLQDGGIYVKGVSKTTDKKIDYEDKKQVFLYFSPTVKEIAKLINKTSFNLYAEVLLRNMCGGFDTSDTSECGLDEVKSFLALLGLDTAEYNIRDGSGISRDNMTNAQTIIGLLEKMTENRFYDDFADSIALCGDEEDISNLKRLYKGTKAEKNARIKTGYLDGVRSYAGYVDDSKGRKIAFAFIVNNYTAKTAEINKIYDSLVLYLAGLE
ncbi:D-alanyl-D-alanine carboxypeptidase / D-alanyl-D-alanine-endopeptidase (penicillin-binding protein 4) [Parelusimicrobium proximum]|uniref:D-alanyl-D-alanine carboxypeptidase/D-alanyl-D-alanine endopeptidase n=1 Tax=Parelusimicrobium proximum TaxID=3228953 RepID=UPI003D1783CD